MNIDLTTHAGYAIACAMRGPDNGEVTSALKWIFTARIRAVCGIGSMFITTREAGVITRDRVVDAILEAEGMRSDARFHYLSHVIMACTSLKLPHLAQAAGLFCHVSPDKLLALCDE